MERCRYGADTGLHEDDIGRFDSRIGPASHGGTDIGPGQDRRIIDAVADEEDRTVLLAQHIHLVDFILRQQLGPDIVDARLGSDVVRCLLGIASEHGRRNAHTGNSLNGIDGIVFDSVRNDQPARIGPIDGDVQFRTVFHLIHGRQGDVLAVQELAIARGRHGCRRGLSGPGRRFLPWPTVL